MILVRPIWVVFLGVLYILLSLFFCYPVSFGYIDFYQPMTWIVDNNASNGNRTRDDSLEGSHFTTKLWMLERANPTGVGEGFHSIQTHPYAVGHPAPDALEGGMADPSADTQLSPFVIPSHVRPAFSALEHHSTAFLAGSDADVLKEK